ncbi:MAG: hypothetical protein FWF59_01635 [Turicibacter sp.]|nr:hypothetical protein [Turicibacter sp.]
MAFKMQYIELDFCHEKKRFICKSDRLGEVLKVLEDGDPFHLHHMEEASLAQSRQAVQPSLMALSSCPQMACLWLN